MSHLPAVLHGLQYIEAKLLATKFSFETDCEFLAGMSQLRELRLSNQAGTAVANETQAAAQCPDNKRFVIGQGSEKL